MMPSQDYPWLCRVDKMFSSS